MVELRAEVPPSCAAMRTIYHPAARACRSELMEPLHAGCWYIQVWSTLCNALIIMKRLLPFPMVFLAPRPCPTVQAWLKQHRSGIEALLTGCHKGHSAKLTLQEQFQPECMTVGEKGGELVLAPPKKTTMQGNRQTSIILRFFLKKTYPHSHVSSWDETNESSQ